MAIIKGRHGDYSPTTVEASCEGETSVIATITGPRTIRLDDPGLPAFWLEIELDMGECLALMQPEVVRVSDLNPDNPDDAVVIDQLNAQIREQDRLTKHKEHGGVLNDAENALVNAPQISLVEGEIMRRPLPTNPAVRALMPKLADPARQVEIGKQLAAENRTLDEVFKEMTGEQTNEQTD